MSVIVQFWIFQIVMVSLFFGFGWKAFQNPMYLIGVFGAFVILGTNKSPVSLSAMRKSATQKTVKLTRLWQLLGSSDSPDLFKVWRQLITTECHAGSMLFPVHLFPSSHRQR